jgi:CheY-like chemotaxis protein
MTDPSMPDQALILLVDDSEDDILLIRQAFAKAGIPNPLQVVRSGEEAVEYLQGIWKYRNREEFPLPAMVLLDLKMPGMDGFEVLSWIRQQPGLSAMRVIVLTCSVAVRDINKAYGLGANSFMVKPGDFQNTVELARIATKYWLVMSQGPDTSRDKRPPGEKGQAENGSGQKMKG